jgi:hypothetical protein
MTKDIPKPILVFIDVFAFGLFVLALLSYTPYSVTKDAVQPQCPLFITLCFAIIAFFLLILTISEFRKQEFNLEV